MLLSVTVLPSVMPGMFFETVRSFLKPQRESGLPLFSSPSGLEDSAEIIEFPSGLVREKILPELSISPVGVDEIIRACNLKSAEVQGTLLEMELEGVVTRLPETRFVWPSSREERNVCTERCDC